MRPTQDAPPMRKKQHPASGRRAVSFAGMIRFRFKGSSDRTCRNLSLPRKTPLRAPPEKSTVRVSASRTCGNEPGSGRRGSRIRSRVPRRSDCRAPPCASGRLQLHHRHAEHQGGGREWDGGLTKTFLSGVEITAPSVHRLCQSARIDPAVVPCPPGIFPHAPETFLKFGMRRANFPQPEPCSRETSFP